MWSRQLSTFAGSFSCHRGASVVSAMRAGFAASPDFPSAHPLRFVLADELDDPFVQALRGCDRRLLQLCGYQSVRAAKKRLGDAIQLLVQPVRSFLANG